MTLKTKQIALFGVALTTSVLATHPAKAQAKPFPTSGHYLHGFVPTAVTSAVAQSSYASWSANYLKTDCGGGNYRVDAALGDASTFSEGQGYGMVLTAYFGDKVAFDGLWSFAQKNFNSSGMMGWHVTCQGFTTADGGNGSATDGDTDIGFALLVAAAQWGGTYQQQATTYLRALKAADFTTCSPSGRNLPTAGNWQPGSNACSGGSNTSYWMPGYYRVFEAAMGDTYWGKAADDAVALYNIGANATTGIIVNDVDQNGAPIQGDTYDYNSCRIPWRAALDYLWFGTPGAQTAMTKITGWVNTVGISKIVDGYNGNGTPTGTLTGMNEFVGGFTAGAMTDSQSLVNTFATYFVGIANDNGTYYGSSLRALYLLELSGNQWNPLEAGDGGPSTGGIDSGTPGVDAGSTAQGIDAGRGTPGVDAGRGTSGADGGSSNPGLADAGAPSTADGGGDSGDGGQGFGTSGGGGCGCRMVPSESPFAKGSAIASMFALLALRRRRQAR